MLRFRDNFNLYKMKRMKRLIYHNEKSTKRIDWILSKKIVLNFIIWLKGEGIFLQIFWSGNKAYPKYGATNNYKNFCYRLRFVYVTNEYLLKKTYHKYDFMLESRTVNFVSYYHKVNLLFVIIKMFKYLTKK